MSKKAHTILCTRHFVSNLVLAETATKVLSSPKLSAGCSRVHNYNAQLSNSNQQCFNETYLKNPARICLM